MKRAFTILELIFVIIILGVLAAIALPKIGASKDEAELGKALGNLKTLISDLSTYALRNDNLSSLSLMSNVDSVENADLSSFTGTQSLNFKVGGDENCLQILFINESNIIAMGIASNTSTKGLIEALAKAQNDFIKSPDNTTRSALHSASQALINADFTSTSTSKSCANLSTSNNFKAMANKIYILLGG